MIGAEVSEQLDYEPDGSCAADWCAANTCGAGTGSCSSDRCTCRRACRSAASPRPDFWRRSSLASIAIIFRSTGRKPFLRTATGFICRARTWPAGWGWLPTGCDPFMSTSEPESWLVDTFRLTRPRSAICAPGHGQTKLGYLWTALSPGGDVVYHWETSRGADCLKKVIPANFQGTLQCDAYAAYASFVKKHKRNITLAGCWAHVATQLLRGARAGTAALRMDPAPDRPSLPHRGKPAPHARQVHRNAPLCASARAVQSASACIALGPLQKSRRYLPRSAIGQAIDYALSNWPLLGVYLEDGRIQIDNNLVENSIRPTALGKEELAVLRRCRCLPTQRQLRPAQR